MTALLLVALLAAPPKDAEAPRWPADAQVLIGTTQLLFDHPPADLSDMLMLHGVDLRWPAALDDTGVVGYEVRRGGKVVGRPQTTTFEESKVRGDQTYEVRALDAAGHRSPPLTAEVVWHNPLLEPPPSGVLASADGLAGPGLGGGLAAASGPTEPSAHARYVSVTAEGGLPPEIVNRIARSRLWTLRAAYHRTSPAHAETNRLLSFQVRPDGTPTEIHLVGTPPDAPLDAALNEQVAQWRFPRAEASTHVELQTAFTWGIAP